MNPALPDTQCPDNPDLNGSTGQFAAILQALSLFSSRCFAFLGGVGNGVFPPLGRTVISLILLWSTIYWTIPATADGATRSVRPNIVFILADDLGYGDLSCQNLGSKIQTPRLDRLANQGVRFTDAHAPSALCTPSRYSILTGQNCWRTRLKSGVLNMWDEPLIAPERLTVATLLQKNGYRTACFGKWHLGLAWPFVGTVPSGFDTTVKTGDIDWTKRIGGGPVDCGFDYYFGVNVANEPPYAFIENDRVLGVPTMQYPTVAGQQGHWAGPGVAGWDWEQVLPQITTNTVRWIKSRGTQNSEPFFLFASLVGPHQPVVPTRQFQGASQAGGYGDYVQELDWAVGELLDALETSGAATNTLVIFTSDNGPDEFAYSRLLAYQHASMGPLRGIKNDVWEGGHRVPFVARWPGNITGGTTNGQTISSIDFMRTVADILGTPLPRNCAEDSRSFLPALLGNGATAATNRMFVMESGSGQFGLRSNNWMYIDSSTGDGHNPELEPLWFKQARKYVSQTAKPALLYDLSVDPTERTNLLEQNPDVAGQLRAHLAWLRPSSTWRGASSGDWTSAQNWVPAGAPAGGDVVYTNLVGLANLYQNLGTNIGVNCIRLDPSVTANVRIGSLTGNELTIANGIDMAGANVNLNIQARLSLSQSQVWQISKAHQLQIAGPLSLGSCGLTITGEGDTLLKNTISGSGWLRIRSSGTTILGTSNSFSGGIELSGGGFLLPRNNGALGAGELVVPNNSSLDIPPAITLTNSAVIHGYGAEIGGQPSGAITTRGIGSAEYNGLIRLSGSAGLRASAAGGVLSIGGSISGDGDLTIMSGSGTVRLMTNQFYTGRTILAGTLQLSGSANLLPTNTDVILADSVSAEFDLNGSDQIVGSIMGGGAVGGNILLNSATLTVAPVNTVSYLGRMSGTGDLEKHGSGTLILGGSNTYSGKTKVFGGALVINGSLASSEVNVEAGTLSGGGSISGPVTIAGSSMLALGIAPGPLTVSNHLILGQQSTTQVELDAATGRSGSVRGLTSVTYAGLLLINNVASTSGFANGQTFRLFSAAIAAGNFAQIQPSPGPGLAWRFDRNTGLLSAVAMPPLQLTFPNANVATISWPGQGFHLQVLTNVSGISMNAKWFDYPGSGTSPITLPIDRSQRSVFFRLVSP